jgi:uncharacterized protein YcbK (DUF882 family)
MKLITIIPFIIIIPLMFSLTQPTEAYTGKIPKCIPYELKSQIRKVERKFGKVTIISTYRKGAKIRGTNRPSKHASCRAIDFVPKKGTYRKVADWLKKNHKGGVGTYSGRFHHIHIDNSSCKRRCLRWHN